MKQTYGYTTYFAMVDVCEALAHEIAAAWLRHDGNAARIRLSELPFRALIGDPFDLPRRPSGAQHGHAYHPARCAAMAAPRSCCTAATRTMSLLLVG